MAEKNKENIFFEKSFSINELAIEAVKRWRILVFIIIIPILISVIYSLFIATPTYDSTAKLYVIDKNANNITTSELSVSTYLTKDFSEIITDRYILSRVAEDLGGNYSYGKIKRGLSVNIPQSTRIIEITCRTDNPKDSKKIVDSVCKVSQENLAELMGLDRITLISEGSLPTRKSTPNLRNNIAVAFLISILLSLVFVFVSYITNNKLTSSEDVKKYLDINILGTIPYNPNKLGGKN